MKISITALLSLWVAAIPSPSRASTVCYVDEMGWIRTISWSEKTMAATVTDANRRTYPGRVTLRRPHDEGLKVNILVFYDKPLFGQDAAEYIIFPIDKHYRVIEVTYLIRDGERFLNTADGGYDAACTTLSKDSAL